MVTYDPFSVRGVGWVADAEVGKSSSPFANYGAGQCMIGTVLMLFCGLPAITRSL